MNLSEQTEVTMTKEEIEKIKKEYWDGAADRVAGAADDAITKKFYEILKEYYKQ